MSPIAPAEPLHPPPTQPPSPLSRAWRGWPGGVARLAFAVLPLFWLAQRVTLGEVAAQARAVGPWSVLGAFVAFLSGVTVTVVRWTVLLRAYGATRLPPLRTMARHVLVAIYYNVLPSGLAGDIVRSHRVRDYVPTPAASYAVVFVERVVGLVGLLVIGASALALGSEVSASIVGRALAAALGLAAGGAAILLGLPVGVERRPALRRAVERVPLAGGLVLRIPAAHSARPLFGAIVLSLFTQGFAVLAIVLLTRPLVTESQLAACLPVIPLAILLAYVPLTPGGVMQREAVFALLYGLAAVPTSSAVAVSLLLFAIQLAIAGLGGAVHALEGAFGWESNASTASRPSAEVR